MSKNTEAVLGRRTRYLILGLLFAVTGIGKIWLWTEGAANDFGLYLGIAMCSGACGAFWTAWRCGAERRG